MFDFLRIGIVADIYFFQGGYFKFGYDLRNRWNMETECSNSLK